MESLHLDILCFIFDKTLSNINRGFGLIDVHNTLITLQLVCKRWRDAIKSEKSLLMWKQIYSRLIDKQLSVNDGNEALRKFNPGSLINYQNVNFPTEHSHHIMWDRKLCLIDNYHYKKQIYHQDHTITDLPELDTNTWYEFRHTAMYDDDCKIIIIDRMTGKTYTFENIPINVATYAEYNDVEPILVLQDIKDESIKIRWIDETYEIPNYDVSIGTTYRRRYIKCDHKIVIIADFIQIHVDEYRTEVKYTNIMQVNLNNRKITQICVEDSLRNPIVSIEGITLLLQETDGLTAISSDAKVLWTMKVSDVSNLFYKPLGLGLIYIMTQNNFGIYDIYTGVKILTLHSLGYNTDHLAKIGKTMIALPDENEIKINILYNVK